MQLSKLNLRNFQAHEDTALVFSPTITTIVGPTDAGKSAVLRALRWVCLNDLTGDGFVREGASSAEITLHLSDKTEVRRCKGKENLYELDGKEYRAFGINVPSDIQKVLSVNEINFQGQHDAPFWFTESAVEVSRRLNSVIDLSVIDTALSNIATQVRQAQITESVCEDRLTLYKQELEKLDKERDRIDEFNKLSFQRDALEKLKNDFDQLSHLTNRASKNRSIISSRTEEIESLQKVVSLGQRCMEISDDLESLKELTSSIKTTQSACIDIPNSRELDEAVAGWRKTHSQWRSLSLLLDQVDELQQDISSSKTKLEKAETRFHKETKGQKCPLCGSQIE